MSVILLAGSAEAMARWQERHPTQTIAAHAAPEWTVASRLKLPGARIVRLDSWKYSERVMAELRALDARHPLSDPTGLLGGSTHADLHPPRVTTMSLTSRRSGVRSPTEPPSPRSTKGRSS